MRRPLVSWLALALLATAGCRSRSDLVEAELRTKDRQLREMRGELMGTRAMNEALENSLNDQRCAQPGVRTSPLSQVKDIQLGRGTGGIDEDNIPGDEGLQIVLVPHDGDGSAIKAAGSLRVTALEITPEGLKTPLSTWEVSATKLRQSWRSGLLSTGYFVALPWQRIPSIERLRVVATFMPLEGGVFEAERDVTIRLMGAGQHLHPQPSAPPAGLAPPVPAPVGPMPRSAPPMLPAEPLPGQTAPTLPPPTPGTPWQPAPATAELMPPLPGR
jgi:hypothetical protein